MLSIKRSSISSDTNGAYRRVHMCMPAVVKSPPQFLGLLCDRLGVRCILAEIFMVHTYAVRRRLFFSASMVSFNA